ncbi:MAG: glycerate kinase [Panacibacter sp.]
MMHILIAPNAFKHSLDAASAAEAISKGFTQSKLSHTSACFPIGDGGDGTADLLIKKFNGSFIETTVHDPLKRKITASFGLIDHERTAVIELANASGVKLLQPQELNPLKATTFGTGELIKHALDKKVKKIFLCIGGSATVDGGAGILQALGVQFKQSNTVIDIVPQNLIDVDSIDITKLDKRIVNVEVIILCDVENVLLGENGSAKIFGPQKGANSADVIKLEQALAKLRSIVLNETGSDMSLIKHGGAAGGVAAGLCAILNATLVNGIEYFLDITGFDEALQNADLLITGEGSIDTQTLEGKAPFGVAYRAKEKNIPVIGLAGKVPLKPDAELHRYFDVLLSINNEAATLDGALKNTYTNLVRTANELGNLFALKK